MPQKKNLNVAPYYDDFDKSKNFQEVLFRPGYAVQARELTTLQSILKNQQEQSSKHLFKEGAMVIPGQINYVNTYFSLKLATQFSGEDIDPSTYYNADTPVTITGVTSGVQAQVIGYAVATATEQPVLFLQYVGGGTDNVTTKFQNSENIKANVGITHTSSYSTDIASATTYSTSASARGCAAKISEGVYYIRGNFVEVSEETLVLEKYTTHFTGRVGFTITETIVTPESDSTLPDNSTGTSNYAAKGAHRLKISVALAKLEESSTSDADFVELMRVKKGVVQTKVRKSEFGSIEDTFARRTHDESGDYTTRPFQFEMKESVTVNENEGVFTVGAETDDYGTASSDLLALKISPGKAYVNGYEIEKISPVYKDINKSRAIENVNAGVSPWLMGNYALITKVYGTPDIDFVSGELVAYKEVQLYDTLTSTRGSASGTHIGSARVRAIEYYSGTTGAASDNLASQYKAYLFDVRPFTKLTLSGTPSATLIANHSNGGVQVKGVTSGATGYVYATGTSGTNVNLTGLSGAFSSGEKITASDSAETDSIVETSSNVDLTISSIASHTFANVRQLYMQDAGATSGQDFTADVVTESTGELELVVLEESSNAAAGVVVTEAGDDLSIERVINAKLYETEKNLSIVKISKSTTKTHLTTLNSGASDSQFTFRKQFVSTSNSSGVVSLSAGTNETFVSEAEKDYTISILTAGSGGAGEQGEIVPVTGKTSGAGTGSFTITDNTLFGNGAKVKVVATLLKTAVASKTKTTKLSKQLKVDAGATHAFGSRPTDKQISLGRADVFKLQVVYDSEDTSTDASAPELSVGDITGTFVKGEKITGGTSGATGRLIDISTPLSYVLTSVTSFAVGEIITGESSSAVATTTAVTDGSTVITTRYTLDTGQRDNYYDIARLERKPSASPPTGRLLVVYDYFEHGSGTFFTVDSYVDVANQMDYEDIPTYTATKVDPDLPAPSGNFPLYDVFDFRPRTEDIAGASSNIDTVDEITGNSFDFYSRQFDGTGASTTNWPQTGSTVQSDFEYYLPKNILIHLNKEGTIIVTEGASSEKPMLPKEPENAMKLAEIFLPAFTFKPQDCQIIREKNQRYTMRDIGRLEDRVENVEYYTALSLLERDAESFEITDANGLNRFKSGFVVDNFGGHKIGDVGHKDYKISMDGQSNVARPVAKMKAIGLIEKATTDAARTTAGYQKTGDLITLPYTEEVLTEQPYGTRLERVAPVLVHQWTGHIELSPPGDEWFESEVAPALIINVEGNYNTILKGEANAIGTVWNSWQTQWSGVVNQSIQTSTVQHNTIRETWNITRTATTTRTDLQRTGINTQVLEKVDRETQSSRIISRAMVPFIRSRNVSFVGTSFLPNTRLYAFFDRKPVSIYVTPDAGYTDGTTTTPLIGSALVSNGAGTVKGTFAIPDPKVKGNPKFQTGEVSFRLTSSITNDIKNIPSTGGEALYQAKGILETSQETIIATRNATIKRSNLQQTTSVTDTNTNTNIEKFPQPGPRVSQVLASNEEDDDGDEGGNDPLAQTFKVNKRVVASPATVGAITVGNAIKQDQGYFLTSIDIYFGVVDDKIPVTLELRNTANGYPGPKILPFGRVVKEVGDITVDLTGATPTNFKFPSPVYIQADTEYCFVLMSNVPTHKVWISRMGETEIGGTRQVQEQPHTGVLFKSHNNSAWGISLTEDIKFRIKCAEFTTGNSGTVTLNNTALESKTLSEHALVFTHSNTALKIKHPDHHMYSTSNNVTIAGAASGTSTTLNGAITSSATTLTLTSGTNFDDTTGRYRYNSSSEWYIKIDDEIMKYTGISTNAVSSITRAQGGTVSVSHADGATVEFYSLHGVPLTEVNKTFTAIANIEIDSYTVALSSSPTISTGSGVAENGGSVITATENYMYDTGQPIVSVLEVPGSTIDAAIRPTTAVSAGGSQTPFSLTSEAKAISLPLLENYDFAVPRMIASPINETNEMGGSKSLVITLTLNNNTSNISPVIDTQRMSWVSVTNRLNNVDSSSDVYPTTDYVASTEPEGDNNAAIYMTKKVTLANPATALKVFFSAYRHSTADIKVLYKVLRTDDASDFDELSWVYFNTDGSPDVSTPSSLIKSDLNEYLYTAGVTDDGIGTSLDDFISFSIKIVLQGTNSAEPPQLKDLRCIALAT